MPVELSEAIDGHILLALARTEIAEFLGIEAKIKPRRDAGWLRTPGACFVTLTKHGELRGCIGTLEAHRPLIEDVRGNAHAAAFRDPRFDPLRQEEFAEISVGISLLSPPEPLHVETEGEAAAILRPHTDGVVLEYGWRRATFLPQVWQQLPSPRQFLQQLKLKAGLAADFWAEDLRVFRYAVQKWEEGV
ncbi:MAG: AmmeMemoRadiSam system protein A [Thiobacillaceae bacterium]